MCKYCNIVDKKVVLDKELDKKKKDLIWVKSYYVSIHESLQCWKQDEKDVDDLKNVVSDKVYCSLNWQKKKKVWRRDYVSIQKKLKEMIWSLNSVKWLTVWSATTYSFHYKFVASRQQE